MARFRAMGRWPFVRYLATVGAAASLLAWLVVYAAHLVFGVDKPSDLARWLETAPAADDWAAAAAAFVLDRLS